MKLTATQKLADKFLAAEQRRYTRESKRLLREAGPDLLTACERILRSHDENWNVSKMDFKPIDDVRAAVAKARGQ